MSDRNSTKALRWQLHERGEERQQVLLARQDAGIAAAAEQTGT
jgi:hypothetical protein